MFELGDKALEPYALRVGELCNAWAHLEYAVGQTFLRIADWDHTSATAQPMVGCLEVRDQLAAIKVGCVIRCANKAVVDAIFTSVDFIENQLRPARNRFVHDAWVPSINSTAFRVERRPKPLRDLPGHLRTPSGSKAHHVNLDEIEEVILDINHEKDYLLLLSTYMNCRADFDPKDLLGVTPARLHLIRIRDGQRHKDTDGAKQPRPPRPSAASRRKPENKWESS